jgi:hypothetical protein
MSNISGTEIVLIETRITIMVVSYLSHIVQ